MILKPSPVCSSKFSFKDYQFVTFASDLEPTFDYGPVYDDADDCGFSIVSEFTGKHVVFAFVSTERDSEGDAVADRFICVTPDFTFLTAVIYND